jgi:rare lipoprotein A
MSCRKQPYVWVLVLGCSLAVGACTSLPKGQADLDVGMRERGIASWYGDDFHGWVTANGEMYDMYALTGAHRTLPLGTVVRVTNVVNGRQITIRINDRGPYVKGRVLDLSYRAALELNMVREGVSAVYLEVVGHQGLEPWTAETAHLFKAPDDSMIESIQAEIDLGVAPSTKRFIPLASRGDRHVREIPSDVLRERRVRRAGDILTAGRRIDAVAALELS